jgi:hypothetical protein
LEDQQISSVIHSDKTGEAPEAAPPNIDDVVDWDKAVPVASTVKTLTANQDGSINYSFEFEHGDGSITAMFQDYFTDNLAPQSKIVNVIKSGDTLYAIRFTLDESGSIMGMIVMPE